MRTEQVVKKYTTSDGAKHNVLAGYGYGEHGALLRQGWYVKEYHGVAGDEPLYVVYERIIPETD